jgi:hypothetical protein
MSALMVAISALLTRTEMTLPMDLFFFVPIPLPVLLYALPGQNSWGMAFTWRAVKTGPSLQT